MSRVKPRFPLVAVLRGGSTLLGLIGLDSSQLPGLAVVALVLPPGLAWDAAGKEEKKKAFNIPRSPTPTSVSSSFFFFFFFFYYYYYYYYFSTSNSLASFLLLSFLPSPSSPSLPSAASATSSLLI
ncbi:uncharacterized protein ColSpa_12405 [Colletotrichum spaethianum]|uniref:Uncharacterized protein n=1 Tax=Colletotrichum spaethianum TaxID=700344 RepID=A0AA37PHF9_9PEZI|nr:uncharacterized protein ColSpa_12405 [Colletotrichum spaethianum]GKT52224.1 hypothetical protein ColSpa_12405 [Colletotrichum spaethianum]